MAGTSEDAAMAEAGARESGYFSGGHQSTDVVFHPEMAACDVEKNDDVIKDRDVTGTPEEMAELFKKKLEDVEAPSLSSGSGPEGLMPLPPDGGYGWVIVLASFFGNALVDGMCSTFGVFLPYFLDAFPGVGVGKMALAGSLMPCLFLTTGPVASALINCLGCRVVTMSGGLITCVALILATFSPNSEVLIVIYGGLGGIGLSLMYLPSMVMVGFYFEKRRAMATGIASSGSGFGMLILAPLAAFLVEKYHWKGALLVMSGVMLQGLVLGSLMRPLEVLVTTKSQSESELTDEEILLAGGADQSQTVRQDICEDTQGFINNSEKDVYSSKGSESVLLYRKAIQNSLAQKLSQLEANSDHQLESQQHLRGSDCSVKQSNSGQNLNFQNGGVYEHVHAKKMSVTQSCHELHAHTHLTAHAHRQALKVPCAVGNNRVRTMTKCDKTPALTPFTAQGSVVAQSCHEISAHSHSAPSAPQSAKPLGTSRARLAQELLKPMHRQDIFYSGSIASLAQYKSQPDLKSYIASVTVIPDPEVTTNTCFRNSIIAPLRQLIDFSILGNPFFLVICAASVFIQIGYFIPIVYIVDYSESMGSTIQQAAALISVLGISNTVGRTAGGCLANLSWVNYLHLNNVTLLIAGGMTLLVGPACTTYPSLVVYAGAMGFCIGPFASLTTIFLVDYLGLEQLTNSFGLLCMMKGLANIAGAPIAGLLLEVTKSYTMTFYFAGSMFICAGLIFYLLPVVQHCTKPSTPGHSR